jgi:hypothetical protein
MHVRVLHSVAVSAVSVCMHGLHRASALTVNYTTSSKQVQHFAMLRVLYCCSVVLVDCAQRQL